MMQKGFLGMALVAIGLAMPALSQPAVEADKVRLAAAKSFADMPSVAYASRISGACGADRSVNQNAVYCTSENRIYISNDGRLRDDAPYLVAHLMGHAVQVRHGVADRALAAIRRDRAQEFAIRSVVVAQVECLAGAFVAKAGVPKRDWFGTEPFTGAHWGRNPLRVGPKVSVGAAARRKAFDTGFAGGVATCDALGSGLADGLILRAYRGR